MIEASTEIVFNKRVARNTFFMGFRSGPIVNAAKPGQFVMMQVRSGIDPLLRRPFSICGVNGDVLLILYRVVGYGTAILSEKKPGDLIQVLGPLGKGFKFPEKAVQPIMVAGGMGIAPLIFLSLALARKDQHFLAGYGISADVVPLDQLGIVGLSPAIATEDGSQGHHGRVTDLLDSVLSTAKETSFAIFTCGPLPMLQSVRRIALGKNIPCQVSLESTMACGVGACQGCAVKKASRFSGAYAHVCQDGPVFDAGILDWEVM
ncbi:MAG: dihydroorotate dehydrogenase electron transfer subunit [Deltaproteobacteria bacterium]|nr:dihydroorotate dehydrogenase electron transfer subunit [Deltaproteobacteria bacterium]